MSDHVTAGYAALHDGRRLSYRSVGPADGVLVLYLHGAIGSPQRVDPELGAVTGELGIRYVMVSRPGSADRAAQRAARCWTSPPTRPRSPITSGTSASQSSGSRRAGRTRLPARMRCPPA